MHLTHFRIEKVKWLKHCNNSQTFIVVFISHISSVYLLTGLLPLIYLYLTAVLRFRTFKNISPVNLQLHFQVLYSLEQTHIQSHALGFLLTMTHSTMREEERDKAGWCYQNLILCKLIISNIKISVNQTLIVMTWNIPQL